MGNYYEILGISTDADAHAVKKAYLGLVKKYHPDIPFSKEIPDAKEKFRRIKEAYETLINSDLRKTYDKYMLKASYSSASENEEYFRKTVSFYEKGREFYRNKKFQSASKAFQTALNLDADNALYCSWLGLTLSHMPGRLSEAKKWCEKAIELSPYHSDYYVNLAIVYKDAGLDSMADKFFRKALDYDPDNSRAHSWLEDSGRKISLKDMLKKVFRRQKK